MARIPLKARGRGNRFFEAEGVDELISMVLELTAEVSTIRERQFVTERVLEHHDIHVGDAVDAYQLSPEEERRLADDRERLIGTVLRTLDTAPAGDRSLSTATDTDSAARTRAA